MIVYTWTPVTVASGSPILMRVRPPPASSIAYRDEASGRTVTDSTRSSYRRSSRSS
jgi:hypothetical protein